MYLLAQMWWLLLIAYLLGVLFGYVVWRACGLPRFRSLALRDRRQLDDRVAVLERDNARLERAASAAVGHAKQLKAEAAARQVSPAAQPRTLPSPPMPMVPRASPGEPIATDQVTATSVTNAMPPPPPSRGISPRALNGSPAGHLLPAPQNGKADNLRLIRGIGPRLEKILNSMGIFHFEQIASWTEGDLAKIDGYLGGFAGRALRDKWIEQSRKLAGLTPTDDNP